MLENFNSPANYIVIPFFLAFTYYMLRISKLWSDYYKEENKKGI